MKKQTLFDYEYELGMLSYDENEFLEALEYFFRLIALSTNQNPKKSGEVYNAIGDIYFNTNDYEEALVYLVRASEFQKNKGLEKDFALTQLKIARIYSIDGLIDEALNIILMQYVYFISIKDTIGVAKAANMMASVCYDVGKDKKAQKYISHAASLGLQNSVKFVGSQTDMAKFYSAADLFLFPTLYEPFSNACLEAMGYGAVLFTTAQNGVSEILQDSTFIIQDNIQASNILGALLVDSIALERLSIKHRQIALNYSVEKNINASLAVIDELR